MNFAHVLGVALVVHMAQAVYSDVLGYQRARAQWREAKALDPITCGDPPTWDWPLCWSRLAGGAIGGLLTTLGVNAFTGGNP